MSDNRGHIDVVLVTRDRRLRELVSKHRPASATLRSVDPARFDDGQQPRARQWWIDLDCGVRPQHQSVSQCVYFWSKPPDLTEQPTPGPSLRKPCAVSVITALWADVLETNGNLVPTSMRPDDAARVVLPDWLAELHELDLRKFCHKCVKILPTRLGYAEIALYIYDAEQNLLSLAETNSKRHVDLAVPLAADSRHSLAAVALSGKLLITDDLSETCRSGGMECRPDPTRGPNRAAAIAPLLVRGKLCGLIWLCGRLDHVASEPELPLEQVFAFLARCLQHARQYRQARVEARIDRLTGLYNYRWMVEALAKEVLRSQRHGTPLALLMIDLDGLKSVNDRFGHLAGDALLRHTAGKIRSALRQIDSAARIGGDEFVVLLPATDLAGARNVGQRILTAIHTDAPTVEQRTLPVAASLGAAQWERGWDEQDLLRAADKAMYAAKRNAREASEWRTSETDPGVAQASESRRPE